MESFSIGGANVVDFSEFSGGNLLDSIDFDDLFLGIDSEMDVLPDLEMDSEMLAEFSVSGGEESDLNTSTLSVEKWEEADNKANTNTSTVDEQDDYQKVDSSGSGTTEFKNSSSENSTQGGGGGGGGGEEIVSKRDESPGGAVNTSSSPKQSTDKARKSSSSSAQSKTSHGKRKVKVDWTPELHRRFVQAVEQLGVDKAVPSRILELMGIDCLTRHNIASHLQKYRSHRKHLLAREAEAASWTQRRQMYGSAAAAAGGGGVSGKRPSSEIGPWLAPPTMGFPPPMTPMHQHHHGHHHQFRPLHVWGHPTVDQSMMHMWPPKHLAPFPSPQPPPSWPPAPPPPPDPSYWHHHHQRAPNPVLTPGTPCFPRQMAMTPHTPTPRFPAPVPVPGIPPHHAMYKLDPGAIGVPGQSGPQPLVDFQPSKESIDAAIGDALSKPWLPLPLGLKPPSTDSVMGELQRQGIPKVPPSCA